MPVSYFVRLAAFSAAAFTALTFAASAAGGSIAYTTANVNLRAGPGTDYDIVDTMPTNSPVRVEACSDTWCAVTTEFDDEGFMFRSLLKGSRTGPSLPFSIQIQVNPGGMFLNGPKLRPNYATGPNYSKRPYVPNKRFTPNKPSPSQPSRPVPSQPSKPVPSQPSARGEVCFYQQPDFRGANFCVNAGDQDRQIPGSFNNAIRSVSVTGNLQATLCTEANFRNCTTLSSSARQLNRSLDRDISSYIISGGQGGRGGDRGGKGGNYSGGNYSGGSFSIN
jgi:uncharacterized protein YraI